MLGGLYMLISQVFHELALSSRLLLLLLCCVAVVLPHFLDAGTGPLLDGVLGTGGTHEFLHSADETLYVKVDSTVTRNEGGGEDVYRCIGTSLGQNVPLSYNCANILAHLIDFLNRRCNVNPPKIRKIFDCLGPLCLFKK